MYHVVRPECFGRLMHFTVMQDIQHRKYPGVNPSTMYELDEKGVVIAGMITRLAFSPGEFQRVEASRVERLTECSG